MWYGWERWLALQINRIVVSRRHNRSLPRLLTKYSCSHASMASLVTAVQERSSKGGSFKSARVAKMVAQSSGAGDEGGEDGIAREEGNGGEGLGRGGNSEGGGSVGTGEGGAGEGGGGSVGTGGGDSGSGD